MRGVVIKSNWSVSKIKSMRTTIQEEGTPSGAYRDIKEEVDIDQDSASMRPREYVP